LDLRKLTTGERIVAIAGVLLVVDLLVFPWHHRSLSIQGIELITVNRRALQSPNGFWGVIAVLLTIAVVLQTMLSALQDPSRVPEGARMRSEYRMYGAFAVLGLLVIKLLLKTNFLGFGAWLGLILAAAVAYGGYTINQEARGRAA